MTRRARAILFALAAAACAVVAAGATGAYREEVTAQLGELRPVLVTTKGLPARRPLRARTVDASVEERRVPARFLPTGTVPTPEQLYGRTLSAPLPPGSYVVVSQLRAAGDRAPREPRLGQGRRPVEIVVDGAAALADAGAAARMVDIVVTTEPGATGAGRTYVAARSVALLGLRPGADSGAGDVLPGPVGESHVATLALTRSEALELIQAETYARSVRLLAR